MVAVAAVLESSDSGMSGKGGAMCVYIAEGEMLTSELDQIKPRVHFGLVKVTLMFVFVFEDSVWLSVAHCIGSRGVGICRSRKYTSLR